MLAMLVFHKTATISTAPDENTTNDQFRCEMLVASKTIPKCSSVILSFSEQCRTFGTQTTHIHSFTYDMGDAILVFLITYKGLAQKHQLLFL